MNYKDYKSKEKNCLPDFVFMITKIKTYIFKCHFFFTLFYYKLHMEMYFSPNIRIIHRMFVPNWLGDLFLNMHLLLTHKLLSHVFSKEIHLKHFVQFIVVYRSRYDFTFVFVGGGECPALNLVFWYCLLHYDYVLHNVNFTLLYLSTCHRVQFCLICFIRIVRRFLHSDFDHRLTHLLHSFFNIE
jgi:hypothetical protein